MEKPQPSVLDLLIETHKDLERQGPGSVEATLKALDFIGDLGRNASVADLGCGTGPQTIELARRLEGTVVGLDLFSAFVDTLNERAAQLGLAGKAKGIVGSMDNLPFEQESLDLIWSEGAVDNIGLEKGLTHWHGFLKKDGCVAVTCPSWLTSEHPSVIEKFWTDAGSGLDSIERNIEILQTCGYRFIAAFALPENCWTDGYFTPRSAALQELLGKYPGNETAEAFVAENQREVELYLEYGQHYGYVFYIGRKS